MNLTDASKVLDTDKQHISTTVTDIKKYVNQIDEICEHVDNLEVITTELDEWSKELEVKSRRYKK
jgi:biogenesis of lysosome-related organelles complex 1 subunit 2